VSTTNTSVTAKQRCISTYYQYEQVSNKLSELWYITVT